MTLAIAKSQSDLARIHQSAKVIFVPTMGNLHEGHLSLVRQARQIADQRGPAKVCVSIFVNPLQFAPHEDFATYPRTLIRDQEQLAGLADSLYLPTTAELFPEPQEIMLTSPRLGAELCGRLRPSFFTGVLTIVLKLFVLTNAAVAIFSSKDLQQLLLVRMMVRQFHLRNIEIVAMPAVRELDGLALSSRNSGLDPAQRARAPKLFHALTEALAAIGRGMAPAAACTAAAEHLTATGFVVGYIECRNPKTLAPVLATKPTAPIAVLGSAQLGTVTLIDNAIQTA